MTRTIGRLAAIPTPLIFVASVGFALLLLWRQDRLGDIGDVAGRADPGVAVAALVLYLVGLALLCLRWHALVLVARGTSAVFPAAEAFLTSVVVNYAAPVGLAVPARAALTKRALGLTATETGAIAVWEVAVDVLVLGLIGAGWVIGGAAARSAVADLAADARWGLLLGGMVAVAGVVAVVVVARRRPDLRRRLGRAGTGLTGGPRRRPGAAALAIGITVAYWLIQGVVLGLLLDALGVAAGLGLVLGLIGLPVLVGMLSPIPGGAGVREALMVAVARAEGADTAAVLVAAVTYRVALFAAVPILYAGARAGLILTAKHGPGVVRDDGSPVEGRTR